MPRHGNSKSFPAVSVRGVRRIISVEDHTRGGLKWSLGMGKARHVHHVCRPASYFTEQGAFFQGMKRAEKEEYAYRD